MMHERDVELSLINQQQIDRTPKPQKISIQTKHRIYSLFLMIFTLSIPITEISISVSNSNQAIFDHFEVPWQGYLYLGVYFLKYSIDALVYLIGIIRGNLQHKIKITFINLIVYTSIVSIFSMTVTLQNGLYFVSFFVLIFQSIFVLLLSFSSAFLRESKEISIIRILSFFWGLIITIIYIAFTYLCRIRINFSSDDTYPITDLVIGTLLYLSMLVQIFGRLKKIENIVFNFLVLLFQLSFVVYFVARFGFWSLIPSFIYNYLFNRRLYRLFVS